MRVNVFRHIPCWTRLPQISREAWRVAVLTCHARNISDSEIPRSGIDMPNSKFFRSAVVPGAIIAVLTATGCQKGRAKEDSHVLAGVVGQVPNQWLVVAQAVLEQQRIASSLIDLAEEQSQSLEIKSEEKAAIAESRIQELYSYQTLSAEGVGARIDARNRLIKLKVSVLERRASIIDSAIPLQKRLKSDSRRFPPFPLTVWPQSEDEATSFRQAELDLSSEICSTIKAFRRTKEFDTSAISDEVNNSNHTNLVINAAITKYNASAFRIHQLRTQLNKQDNEQALGSKDQFVPIRPMPSRSCAI